jgi:hypothetical protein
MATTEARIAQAILSTLRHTNYLGRLLLAPQLLASLLRNSSSTLATMLEMRRHPGQTVILALQLRRMETDTTTFPGWPRMLNLAIASGCLNRNSTSTMRN